jgi:hypothetical protein
VGTRFLIGADVAMEARDVCEGEKLVDSLDVLAASACQYRDRLFVGGDDGSLRVFRVISSERDEAWLGWLGAVKLNRSGRAARADLAGHEQEVRERS